MATAQLGVRDARLYQICWRTNIGDVRRSAPMPRYLAEFRAREGVGHATMACWVEEYASSKPAENEM
ncbi:MAG: hypothetical protein HQL38_17590 [Alphaproteobacteria bacterium]|nr:hypothetical protein [Alphaproteobacteria bacterium]